MTVGQASDSMKKLTYSFHRGVGALCLSLAGPTVAQLEFFLLVLTFFGSLAILFSFLCDDALHKLGNIYAN